MGSRGHIAIVQSLNSTPIYFYTHWEGHKVCATLAEALSKADQEGRLNDESYAARIIFDVLTGCTGDSTGFGIIIGEPTGDNEFPIPFVRWYRDVPEPFVTYQNNLYSATNFIAIFSAKKTTTQTGAN
jgi:hypothetical protein